MAFRSAAARALRFSAARRRRMSDKLKSEMATTIDAATTPAKAASGSPPSFPATTGGALVLRAMPALRNTLKTKIFTTIMCQCTCEETVSAYLVRLCNLGADNTFTVLCH